MENGNPGLSGILNVRLCPDFGEELVVSTEMYLFGFNICADSLVLHNIHVHISHLGVLFLC